MKILIAGATGAIGLPLISYMVREHHEVIGITQSPSREGLIFDRDAVPLVLDVLDQKAVHDAVAKIRPDVIVDMLTKLPKEYTQEAMREAAPLDAKIRLEGGENLLSAAKKLGVKKYIAQSTAFYYAQGEGKADETTPFALHTSPGVSKGAEIYQKIEERVLNAKDLEGIALRFGFFYGPNTWFFPEGNVADQIKKGTFPLIGNGEGYWNFVHIEDAAKAVVAAINLPKGAYNIVNDRPVQLKNWLPAFAKALNAPAPPQISLEDGLSQQGADSVYYATKLRAASNDKAKKAFDFEPKAAEWM